MLRKKTVTGVILARGGSRGLKLKNIQYLAGKPLIYYTIQAAKESGIFDNLVVSSDSAEIRAVAKSYGVKTIDRPLPLASDTATSEDAMAHALSKLNRTDYAVLLEPTHPLLKGIHLRAALDMLISSRKDAILSVIEAEVPYVGSLGFSLSLRDFVPRHLRKKRRQDLESAYYIGGGVYIAKWDIMAKAGDFFDCDSIAYVLPKINRVDINNREDLEIAEKLLKKTTNRISRGRVIWRVIKRICIG